MKIFRELKKIFGPWQILLTVLIMMITYMGSTAYVSVDSGHFSWFDYYAAFTREMQEHGFETMTPEAEEWLRLQMDQIYGEYSVFFENDPFFSEHGITSFEEFQRINDPDEIPPEAYTRFYERFETPDNTLNTEWKRQIIEQMLETSAIFESGSIDFFEENYDLSSSARKDLEKMIRTGKWRSLLPDGAVYVTNIYWQSVLYGMMLSVFLLIAPYLTGETVQKVRAFQYTSGTGRKILLYQLAAAFLASMTVYVVWTVIFMAVFTHNHHFEDFFRMGILSQTFTMYRVTMPYIAYLGIILLLCLLSVLMTASVSFAVSMTSSDYVSVFLKSAVAYGSVCFLHCKLLFTDSVFSLSGFYNRLLDLKGAEVMITAALLLVWLAILARLISHAQKEDLL